MTNRSSAEVPQPSLAYSSFLNFYPHPAFVLEARSSLQSDFYPSLNPIFSNPAFRSFTGFIESAGWGSELPESFPSTSEFREFVEWLNTDSENSTKLFTLNMLGNPTQPSPIELNITKTRCDALWVCTTVPTTPIPRLSRPSSDSTKSRLQKSSPGPITLLSRAVEARSPTISSTLYGIDGEKSPMMQMLETFDWSSTTLGPREKWSESLNSVLSVCMTAPHPSALWWSEDAVLIYNDRYIEIAGSKHPRIYGKAGPVAWAEVWQEFSPLIVDEVYKGRSIHRRNHLLFMGRLTEANLPEELYFDWSYRPVINEEGKVEGFLNDAIDMTRNVVLKRRMRKMQQINAATILSKNKAEFVESLMQALAQPEFAVDVPFAAFYFCETEDIVDGNEAPKPTKIPGGPGILSNVPVENDSGNFVAVKLQLAETIGISRDHPAAPEAINLVIDLSAGKFPTANDDLLQHLHQPPCETPSFEGDGSSTRSGWSGTDSAPASPLPRTDYISSSMKSVFQGKSVWPSSPPSVAGSTPRYAPTPWPFAKALRHRKPVHVTSLPDYISEGLDKRGWNDRPREAVIIPIGIEGAIPEAMLVLGINTRRPYDGDYGTWVQNLMLHLSATYKATFARMQDQLRVNNLAEIDAAKTAFFSNISHELRTPLTLITLPVHEATTDPSIPEGPVKENLKLALRNVRRLDRLVDSLLDFSRLAAKKLEGQFQPVKLGILSAELASSFRSLAEHNGLVYRVLCDMSDEQPDCFVDPDFWEKIVFNIIVNAYKYTLKGSITVAVKYDIPANIVSFSVTDTGSGIPDEDIEKIFTRFHRVASTSRTAEGTGIGLSLTKDLVELHGGTLSVISSQDHENHGSTFTITLPLGHGHLAQAHIVQSDNPGKAMEGNYGRSIVEEASLWTTSMTPEQTTVPFPGPTTGDSDGSSFHTPSSGSSFSKPPALTWDASDLVLVVDDNADMRQLLKSVISKFCKVIEADNGVDAFILAQQHQPQVIISDIMMPRMNGFDLLEEIRHCPETKLIPVMLMTAKVEDDVQQHGFIHGADDYIAKPIKKVWDVIIRVYVQSQLGKNRIALERNFEREQRELRSLLELAPVAIFRLDQQKRIRYVNPRWYDITGQSHNDTTSNWTEMMTAEDQDAFKVFLETKVYRRLPSDSEEDGDNHTIDLRFKNKRIVKCQTIRVEDDGALGTLTDITDLRHYEEEEVSHAKEREGLARKRAEEAEIRQKEAEDRRRDQELLVDVTSHELRQPVSAILNCSSLVKDNLVRLKDEMEKCRMSGASFLPSEDVVRAMMEDVEALDSIYQCGLAQERIANDVLSFSRLQLNVLRIDAVEFELRSEITRILLMFKSEVKMRNITLDPHFGTSFETLNVKWISADRARLGQVITNLLSNAIKFTDTSTGKRNIMVDVEISLQKPADDSCKLPPSSPNPCSEPEPGSEVFIYVSVTDSGPGLDPEDWNILFQRFHQGSHKHEVFGGSGLGLFISKGLCELMGGDITVDRVYGEGGATFRFYIKSIVVCPPLFEHDEHSTLVNASSHSIEEDDSGEERIPKVMIVEDNEWNQKILTRQLRLAGCETVLAGNGLQALEILKKEATARSSSGDVSETNTASSSSSVATHEMHTAASSSSDAGAGAGAGAEDAVPSYTPPEHAASSLSKRPLFDLILMDVEMPVMDGLTAVGEIRKMESASEGGGRLNVVALTGNAREGQVEKIWKAGMSDVLIKPYRIENILAKIPGHHSFGLHKSKSQT